jgi:poly(A) polymerase
LFFPQFLTIPLQLGISDPVSLAGPAATDVAASEKLEAFLRAKGLYEDEAGRQLRERVLGLLNDIVTRWLAATLREKKGLTAELAAAAVAGPCIYTFGSYRLGVAGANADIDTLCVGPRQIEMADFFGSLQTVLRARSEISSLVAVPDAYVPVMKLVFCGVDIDLLFSRLATSSIPRLLDLRDDSLVASMEEKARKRLFVYLSHL